MAIESHYKVSGTWRRVSQPWYKVAGTWRQVSEIWYKVGGVWKQTFSLFSPFSQTFNSGSGSTVVPTGAAQLVITNYGSGGVGAFYDGNPADAAGGGGGAYSTRTIVITPADWGATLTYAVGSPSSAALSVTNFSGTVSAGNGGDASSPNSGGAGGTASGGSTNTNGTAGSNFAVNGGAGAGPSGGAGGASSGANGSAFGGGGAGDSSGSGAGNGGAGQVKLDWT